MNKSEGIVVRIPDGKNFGFIRVNGKDYFFHKEDFNGNWEALKTQLSRDMIKVQFDIVDSIKGPRASNVTVIDS